MTASNYPEVVQEVLEKLRDYMHGFYPDREKNDPLPLEFWRIGDDDLFLETLSYLPLQMPVTDEGIDLAPFPEGFRLAFPIFWLEDDYQFNGWTALTNAGEWLLPGAVAAYERIGMLPEAKALAAALAACRNDPDDTEAAEAAYKSVPNPFADDEAKHEALLAFFRGHSHLFEPR
jgi:hypothetical protein